MSKNDSTAASHQTEGKKGCCASEAKKGKGKGKGKFGPPPPPMIEEVCTIQSKKCQSVMI